MPSTWRMYGVDANKDGEKDPFNPVDAIFAAARYLKAAGADKDVRARDLRLQPRRLVRRLRAPARPGHRRPPRRLVGSLTGLAQGRFPVHAKATYAGQLRKADRTPPRAPGRQRRRGRRVRRPAQGHRDLRPQGRPGGRRQRRPRRRASARASASGRFVKLLDVYGNTYTYAHLGSVAKTYPTPKRRKVKRARDPPRAAPDRAATASRPPPPRRPSAPRGEARRPRGRQAKQRIAAEPRRHGRQAGPARPPRSACSPTRSARAPSAAGGAEQLGQVADLVRPRPARVRQEGLPLQEDAQGRPRDRRHRARPRRRATEKKASHLPFEIRPAGRGAPRIDPKPVLDGWKLLESTAIYRAAGKNPFFGEDAGRALDRPDPADEQGDAVPARARRPAHRDLRLRPRRHPQRPDRPPRAGHARVPRRLGPQAHRDLAAAAATAT